MLSITTYVTQYVKYHVRVKWKMRFRLFFVGKFPGNGAIMPQIALILSNVPLMCQVLPVTSLLRDALPGAIPDTVEEYCPPPQKGHGLRGVSWWRRVVRVPDNATLGHVALKFDAARHRAAIFLNNKLIGYGLTGNSPFAVS